MTLPTTIWVCAVHHPGFRCGGWAGLVSQQRNVVGAAGGDRNTTAARMALAGLAWALASVQPESAPMSDGPIVVHTTGPELASLVDVLAGRPQPNEDRALWAEISGG